MVLHWVEARGPLCCSLVTTKYRRCGSGDPSVTVLSQLSLLNCHAAAARTRSSPCHCLAMTDWLTYCEPLCSSTLHCQLHCPPLLSSPLLSSQHISDLHTAWAGLALPHTANEWKHSVRYTITHLTSQGILALYKCDINNQSERWGMPCWDFCNRILAWPGYNNYWSSSFDGNLFINQSKPKPNIYN